MQSSSGITPDSELIKTCMISAPHELMFFGEGGWEHKKKPEWSVIVQTHVNVGWPATQFDSKLDEFHKAGNDWEVFQIKHFPN